MANKRIFDINTIASIEDIDEHTWIWIDKKAPEGEPALPSWRVRGDIFLKVLNNFATHFVPNVLTVVGKCYWYGGDLYECNTAYSGAWVPANFTATSIDELFARKDVLSELQTNVTTLTTYAENVAASIATPFDPTRDYAVGESCNYEGTAYIFTSNHPAGAWNPAHATISGQKALLQLTAQNALITNFGKTFVSAPKTTFLKLDTTKNMIDVKTSIKDYIIRGKDSDGDRGTTRYASGYSCTDFIPVEGGESYYADFTYVSGKSYAFYDKDFNWISGANAGADETALTSPFTAPGGACWVRVSYLTTSENRVWMSSINGTHRQEDDPSLTEVPSYATEGITTSEKEFNTRFDTRINEYMSNFESVSFDKKNPKVFLSLDVNSKWKTENCLFTKGFKYNNIIKKILPVISVTTGTETNAYVWCDLDSYVDATAYPLQIIIKSSELDDVSVFNGLQIEAYSEGYTDTSHRIRCFVQYEASATVGYNADFVRNGWFNLCYNLKSATTSANTGASFDFTKISRIGVKIFKVNGNVRHIDIARLAFIYPMKRPGVVTIVDNFNVSVPAMADYAYSKGVRLNLSIVPGFYDGDPAAPACASLDELRRIAAQGHFIFNHTYRHLNFNELTDAEIAEEIILSEKWMQENDFAYGKKYISIPSARFNSTSCDAVLATNAESIFHTWSMITNNAKKVVYPFYPCTRCLDQSNLDSTFANDVSKAIDNVQAAIDYSGVAVIGFHGTYWTLYNDGEKWKQYIDAIAAMNLYHYGIDELVDGNFI